MGLFVTSTALAGSAGFCYDPSDRAGFVCPACGCEADYRVVKNDGPCGGCEMERVALKDLTHVAILIHDGVELLDFTGPAEVFATAGGRFHVYTVSQHGTAVTAQGFMKIEPNYSMRDCPWPDVLVIPGGSTDKITESVGAMDWVREVAKNSDYVLSVCSGAFVLARAGMLDGLEATAHAADVAQLKKAAPRTKVHENARFVDNGRIITAGGVSSGIDGALRVVQKLYGDEAAAKSAQYIEYDRWSASDGIIASAKGAKK
jgi:transcriptional regulator GlxA family with amidase domain